MLLQPRHLARLSATIGVFTRFGLADFIKRQGLGSIAPEADADGEGPSPEKAVAFRKRLVELGPAYIKLGQLLSTRPDLLPVEYVAELERLQDDVDAIPTADVASVIEEELHARLSKLFSDFDPEPIGSASLGQVHAASLRDGRSVVIKVQRPHIRDALAEDLAFFRELAAFLGAHTAAGARVDLVGIVQQLDRAIADELDYRIEARNAATIRRSLAEFPRILVPRVIEGYTTERVLTTERIRGTKINAISPLARLEHDFHAVAEELTRAYLKQIVIDGHFHADPHPGNVFVITGERDNPPTPAEISAGNRRAEERTAVTPLARIETEALRSAPGVPDDADLKLALIDFGMTARLSAGMRHQVIKLLMDIADGSGDEAAMVLVEIGEPLPGFDRAAYVATIAGLMARHVDRSIGDLPAGSVLYELIGTSYQECLKLPSELTLLAKALFNLDVVTRALDPTFNPIPTIRSYANDIASERAKHDLNPRRIFQLATAGTDLLMALPHRIDRITERLSAGEFETRITVPELATVMSGMEKVANRVFSGLIVAALIVASAMLMPYQRSLGLAGFVLSGALGFWMVLTIVWTDRKTKKARAR